MKQWKAQERLRHWLNACALACALILLVGCLSRGAVVYVPDGQPLRLRETIKAVDVWVPGPETGGAGAESEMDGWTPATMDLPEGWYVLPDSELLGRGPP